MKEATIVDVEVDSEPVEGLVTFTLMDLAAGQGRVIQRRWQFLGSLI